MAKVNFIVHFTAILLALVVSSVVSSKIPLTKKATFFEKEPTVQIQCLSGNMIVTILNSPVGADGLFSGMVYPKGLSSNSSCLSEYRSHKGILKYKLPLRSCNTMPKETDDGHIEFFNTIILQPHLKLMTEFGRGYHVRCSYKNREAAIESKKDGGKKKASLPLPLVSESTDRRDHGRSLSQSNSDTNEIPMPSCHMKIYSGDKLAESVKIGDPLKIVVNIDEQEKYGLHVTDCSVRDGIGLGEQKLLDNHGCPLDQDILGPFTYDSERTKATVTFPAHKFPYTTSVYYQCNIRLCLLSEDNCHKTPSCDRSSRIKRETDGSDDGLPATIEVFSGLYVNENAEVIGDEFDSVFKEKTPEDAICVSQRSFAIAVSITGLCLMLAVVLAVLCILAKRRDKSSTNSNSSIYSGPYTNTAYSHTS